MVDAAGTLKLVKATAPLARVGASAAARAADGCTRATRIRTIPAARRSCATFRCRDWSARSFAAKTPTSRSTPRCSRSPACSGSNTSSSIRSDDGATPGDLVLAGPAGDWRVDPFGRIVSADTGAPIVRLDDLLTLLRRRGNRSRRFFGCAINPRQAALAATQAYLDKSAARPLEPGRRDAWLEEIRETLGRQDIEIFGIDPTSRVARVLVEADVHMKLIGMGLEDGVPGVESYLDAVKAVGPTAGGDVGPPLVVRAPLRRDPHVAADGDAYELVGDGVRVLSENEALAAQGQRVHTGQSDPLNQQFADSFTAHFARAGGQVSGLRRAAHDLRPVAGGRADRRRQPRRPRPLDSRPACLDNEKLRLPHVARAARSRHGGQLRRGQSPADHRRRQRRRDGRHQGRRWPIARRKHRQRSAKSATWYRM